MHIFASSHPKMRTFLSPQAIKIAAQATMRMRPETISRAHFDLLHSTLDPLIATAPQRLQQQEAQNIAEDRLSLLYTELIPPGMLVKPVASLAQRLKNMSHVNLGGVNVARQNSNDTGDDGSDCDSVSDGRASSSGRGSMGRSGSVGRAPSSGECLLLCVCFLFLPSCVKCRPALSNSSSLSFLIIIYYVHTVFPSISAQYNYRQARRGR